MADDKVVDLEKRKRLALLKAKAWQLLEAGEITEAQRAIEEMAAVSAGRASPEPVPLSELVESAMLRAERRAAGEEKPVPTPWKHLNATLGGGLWPGAHFLVAGTGVGKSQLSFQIARHAAKAGVPVGLIALELDEMQLVMRLAAEETGVRWSDVYNGKAGELDMARVRRSAVEVGKLPIVTDFGQAMGWPASRLEHVVRSMRERYPEGPALVVLDFIQLIAPETEGKPLDLRERIGRAGYLARNLSRQHGVSIVIVSSTARENYSKLSQTMRKLGLCVDKTKNGGTRRTVRFVDQLVGLGKESGEIEFSADSVNVLLQPETKEEVHPQIGQLRANEGKVVVCASVKVRAGVPSWFALGFQHGRFVELQDEAMNSLDPGSDADGSTDPLEIVRKVYEAVKKADDLGEKLKNPTAVAARIGGRKQDALAAVRTALLEGYISDAMGCLEPRQAPPGCLGDDLASGPY